MRSAPSVVYPVGRCAFQVYLLLVVGGITAAVGIVFLIVSEHSNQGAWGWFFRFAGGLVWVVWAAWAAMSWFRSPEGTLCWEPRDGLDGVRGGWSWNDQSNIEPAKLSTVECVLDLQNLVLLCIGELGRRRRWVWVAQESFPTRWKDLRRALLSNRR